MPDRDRLSALDAAFLDLDDADAPLHVGWTMRLHGRAPGLAALRRHLDARMDRVPRFRRRVVRAHPLGAQRVWADDPGFDIARHVHAVSAPPPGGPGDLRRLAGTLLSSPLDPGRPLWRVTLVGGLADGFALVGQAHHALVDGVAALEVAALLFDAEPAPAPEPAGAGAWRPATRPAPAVEAVAAVRRGAGGARSALRLAGRLAADAPDLREATAAVRALARPAPQTTLDRTAGPARVVAFADVALEAAREAGRARDATVNDVLLAGCSLALGRALRRRGERPVTLKALVPVDVRDDATTAMGNRISFIAVDLPVGEPDPGRVLHAVRAQTHPAKNGDHAAPLDGLARAADLLPARGRSAIARLALHASPFNVVVSNVPGPQQPLFLLGRRVTAILPAVPVVRGHGLSVGAISYCGRLGIGLYADAGVVPDALDVARDLERAVDALRSAPEPLVGGPGASAPVTPWRRRARDRRASQPGAARG